MKSYNDIGSKATITEGPVTFESNSISIDITVLTL